MNVIMSYYFLSQRHERDYVKFIEVKNDFKHASTHVIHAMHLRHNLDDHVEERCSTPHFSAVHLH